MRCHNGLRWLTAARTLGDSLSGVFYSYDIDRPIHFGLAPSEACLFSSQYFCCVAPCRGLRASNKTETPQQQTQQQTNQKIQELAALASTRPHDVPVGTGDLLHIDVFDVAGTFPRRSG